MAEPGRPGFLETLRLGWKPSYRRPTTLASEAKTAETPTTTKSVAATEEVTAPKSSNGGEAATKPAEAKTPAAEPPKPNLDERMEGLQGWMAEIERKQRRLTLIGTVGTLAALLAAGAALYFAIATPNSASKDDFDDLETQVETLQGQVTRATTDQARLKAINSSVEALGARVTAAEQNASQQATEIAAAKAQAQAAQQAAATATPAPAPIAPTTPTTPGTPKQP
jgi:hypothetical protein